MIETIVRHTFPTTMANAAVLTREQERAVQLPAAHTREERRASALHVRAACIQIAIAGKRDVWIVCRAVEREDLAHLVASIDAHMCTLLKASDKSCPTIPDPSLATLVIKRP